MKIFVAVLCSWVALAQATLPDSLSVFVEGRSPKDALEASDVVFAGYAVEQCTRFDGQEASRDHQFGTSRFVESWEFEVVAVWKGEVGRPVLSPPLSGYFRLGELYLVYAEEHNGMLERGGRARKWSEALADLYQLPRPLKVVPPFEVPSVNLNSLIDRVIDGKEVNWIIKDFKWLTKDADRIVPVFASVLRSQTPGDTQTAMDILGYMGPASHAAIPDLERIAKSESERLRKHAFMALNRIETNDAERVRWINECLSDSSPDLRRWAIWFAERTLHDNKQLAERDSFITKLEAVSQTDSDLRVRESASRALKNLNGEQ